MSTANVLDFAVPPVVKTVDVPCPPALAFERFTRDIHLWWPLRTHSLGQAETRFVAFEPRVGSRLYERQADGQEHPWGSIIAWDAPSRLAIAWHVGRSPDSAQTVEVTFTARDDGGTRVRLAHSGWERLGAEAERRRGEYDNGWNLVFLQCYALHALREA